MKKNDDIEVLKQFDSMVKRLAHKWRRDPRVGFDDLVAEGNMAVLRAYRSFDANNGAKLSTYVYHSIKNAMLGYTKENSLMMHCSIHYQRDPEELDFAMKQEKGSVSLDYSLKDGSSIGSLVQASGYDPVESAQRKEELEIFDNFCNEVLNEREKYVIYQSKKYFGTKTLDQIGCDFGISRQRAHQIQQNAFDKLSRKFPNKGELV